MSTSDHTNIKPISNVYETCDSQYLRELREAAGMDLGRLARIACLSVAQIRQLETGNGESLFYSEAIKRQAYKRLLMILGVEPPTTQDSNGLSDVQAHLQTLDQIVAMSHQPQMARRSLHSLMSVGIGKLTLKKMVIGLLFVMTILFVMQSIKSIHDITLSFLGLAGESNLAGSTLPVASVQSSDAGAETLISTTATSDSMPASAAMGLAVVPTCAVANESMPQLSPVVVKKEGRYVYLVSTVNAEVCVVDGNQQATVLQLKEGEGRSVYGMPPWQISSSSLPKIQVFFQGGRMSLPETATRVQLFEAPVQR